MKIDDLRHGRDTDGRYALSEDEEVQLADDVITSKLNNRELGDKWGVSESKIWAMRNPEKHEENKRKRKENYKGKYYDTETSNGRTQKCRAKKRAILAPKVDKK